MTVLDRFDTETITRQARDVHPGRTLLTVIAAVLFAAGWVVARLFALLWLTLAWTAVAIREGWRDGRAARTDHDTG
jgi:hypothetical protein